MKSAVDAYVFLLRAQQAGIRQRGEVGTYALLEGSLKSRNEASIRYRMRNISAVVRELGRPILAAYSPAEQVGANVRPRIRDLLLSSPEFKALTAESDAYDLYGDNVRSDRQHALEKLAELRAALDRLEDQVIRMGHNNPPEPTIAPAGLPAFDEAKTDVDALIAEVQATKPDVESTEKRIKRLVAFGAKASVWAGQRATKFVDVSLAFLAPAFVLQVTGLTPVLLEALSAVVRVIFSH